MSSESIQARHIDFRAPNPQTPDAVETADITQQGDKGAPQGPKYKRVGKAEETEGEDPERE